MFFKNLAFCSITAFLTLLITLVLGEICIRLFTNPHGIPEPPPFSSFNPYRPNKYIVNARPYVFFYIPGSRYAQNLTLYENEYSINSMGFRGEDFAPEPLGNRRRLAVVGDSIVEGHGVRPDQIFTYHLQNKLADSGWEVINLGVQGASPLYFAANLERYLYLNPDAVLLVINENDLYEDELREKMYFDLPFLENRKLLYSGGAAGSWRKKTRLLNFLETTIQGGRRNPLEKIIEEHAQIQSMNRKKENSLQKKSSFFIPASEIEKRWQMSRKYLTYFHADLQKRNIDLLVTSLCSVTLAFPGIEEYTTYCSNMETRVRQWAGQRGIPYLSLVPVMKKALNENKRNEILIFNDQHPAPLTHNIFSEELYPFVYENLIDGTRPVDDSE